MKHLLQQCLEALEIGRDAAFEVAQHYEYLKEYKPKRYAQYQDDVATIESTITALKEALAKDEHEANLKIQIEFEGDDKAHDITVFGTDRDIKRLEARIKYWFELERNLSTKDEQAPVAWMHEFQNGTVKITPNKDDLSFDGWNAKSTPLYTRPAQRQPLSEEEIRKFIYQYHEEANMELEELLQVVENAVYEKLGIK